MATFYKFAFTSASITVVMLTLFGFCHSFGGWNGYRIAQAFSVIVGNGLYDDADSGPIMDNPYGPVSYLLIMPLFLVRSGGPLLVSIGAVMITWLVALAPLAVLLWSLRAEVGRKWSISLAVGAFMLVYSVRSCTVICTSLTAEAPALGFSLLGALFLGLSQQGKQSIVTAGFLIAVGIWSKQTAVLVVRWLLLKWMLRVGNCWCIWRRLTTFRIE